jgi:hypothetical protein
MAFVSSPARRRGYVLGLGALVALAFLARSTGLEQVFVGGGDVVFTTGDPYYHLRLALAALADFPRLLAFDRYLNFPDGSHVPIPPLWTWTLAGVGRLLGGDQRALEHGAAWLPPILGALTLLPVAALARRLAGPAVALGAAALLALLPLHVVYTGVGNPDHHAAESLLGAILLWLYALALAPELAPRRAARLQIGLVAARVAMLLTWTGSLFHLGVGEAALLLAAALRGDRPRLAAQGAGALATAALVLPFAASAVAAGAPRFSSVELTLLHPLAFAAVGGVTLALLALEALRPARGAAARLARLAAVIAVAALVFAATPAVRAGAAEGEAVLTKGNVWHERAAEQRPLFTTAGGFSAAVGLGSYGALCFLIPLAPLAALACARDPARRAPALFVATWSAATGLLAVTQIRFGVDYAPAGAVVLALALAAAARPAARALRLGGRSAAALAAIAGAALLAPGLAAGPASEAVATWRALRSPRPTGDHALRSAAGSLVRFAREVRAVTPETAGFLRGDAVPEYGVLVFPGIGHTFLYEARRATPGGNLGPYAGAANFEAARTFYAIPTEPEAVAVAARLRTPYVTTNLVAGEAPDTLLYRLHVEDGGAARGLPRFAHFRLVTEGPTGGVPLALAMGRARLPNAIPYKLWEIVRSADVLVRTAPGAKVEAQVEVGTPGGRRFVHRAEASADGEGRARIALPYATRTDAPARPVGAWRVTSEGRAAALALDDLQVRAGSRVELDLRPPGAP